MNPKRAEWIRICEANEYQIVRDEGEMRQGNIILVLDQLYPHVSISTSTLRSTFSSSVLSNLL